MTSDDGPTVRQEPRVPLTDVRAAIRIEDTEEWIHVYVGDLSMGGAFFATDRYIVEGTRVDVGFEFPSGGQLFFTAEIIRAVSAAPSYPAGLGVSFVQPTDALLSTLAGELSHRMVSPPPCRANTHAAGRSAARCAARRRAVASGCAPHLRRGRAHRCGRLQHDPLRAPAARPQRGRRDTRSPF